jgi:hypothetical protein
MLVRRAIAILAILRANAVPVLGDFSSDPVGPGKGGDDIADQLRFANAACVPANNDYAPMRF